MLKHEESALRRAVRREADADVKRFALEGPTYRSGSWYRHKESDNSAGACIDNILLAFAIAEAQRTTETPHA